MWKLEKYAICGFCNICDRMCDRMFSYNRYPYNCASVQRVLLAPEILNESFLKCRYFTALLSVALVGLHLALAGFRKYKSSAVYYSLLPVYRPSTTVSDHDFFVIKIISKILYLISDLIQFSIKS